MSVFAFHRPSAVARMKLGPSGRAVEIVRRTTNTEGNARRPSAFQMPIDSVRCSEPVMAGASIAPCATDKQERENHPRDKQGWRAIVVGVAGIDASIGIDWIRGWWVSGRWIAWGRIAGRRVGIAWRRRLCIRRAEVQKDHASEHYAAHVDELPSGLSHKQYV
jgi:hypothetical protein